MGQWEDYSFNNSNKAICLIFLYLKLYKPLKSIIWWKFSKIGDIYVDIRKNVGEKVAAVPDFSCQFQPVETTLHGHTNVEKIPYFLVHHPRYLPRRRFDAYLVAEYFIADQHKRHSKPTRPLDAD